MPCNSSHRYVHDQRVWLDQSVILKDPIILILYFHAEEHHPRWYDPWPGGQVYDFVPATIIKLSLLGRVDCRPGCREGWLFESAGMTQGGEISRRDTYSA